MRKFLSLIFALFVTLPFCTKCYAIEVDSLDDEVRHVVRQSVPANIEILDGTRTACLSQRLPIHKANKKSILLQPSLRNMVQVKDKLRSWII